MHGLLRILARVVHLLEAALAVDAPAVVAVSFDVVDLLRRLCVLVTWFGTPFFRDVHKVYAKVAWHQEFAAQVAVHMLRVQEVVVERVFMIQIIVQLSEMTA